MPLTKKGKKIMGAMKKTYGDTKKAKSVFYASVNKGKINVMPAQNARLSDDQIRLVASYVWSLSQPQGVTAANP